MTEWSTKKTSGRKRPTSSRASTASTRTGAGGQSQNRIDDGDSVAGRQLNPRPFSVFLRPPVVAQAVGDLRHQFTPLWSSRPNIPQVPLRLVNPPNPLIGLRNQSKLRIQGSVV